MSDRYFWQMIFIKYTPDNRRIFYPTFFSDGYFITSEEQMLNYRKYGNKFFLVLLCILGLMMKFKVIKLIMKLHILHLNSALLIVGFLVLSGIIYNLLIEKIIFGKSPKTKEKYWVNNIESVKFLLKFIGNILAFTACAAILILGVLTFCKEFYIFIATIILIVIALIIFEKKQNQKLYEYIISMEYNELQTYFENLLNEIKITRFSDKSNPNTILANIDKYHSILLQWLIEQENLSFEKEIEIIKKYVYEFKYFNIQLYEKDIPIENHLEVIEKEFLGNFEITAAETNKS